MSEALAVADAFRRLHNGIVVPDYENLLIQTYLSFLRPNDVVIDIGAHKGRHTSVFAQVVTPGGRVYAYEPIPDLAAALVRQFAGSPWVSIHNKALSQASGTAEFQLVPEALEQSGLLQRVYDRVVTVKKIRVDVGSLDEEFSALQKLDYIKIDVEGAEIDCLRGGVRLLARTRPVISVEYGKPGYSAYGLTARSLFDFAVGNDYVLSDFFGNLIAELDDWMEVCDRSYWDFFLVPRERAAGWRSIFAPPPRPAGS